MSQKAQKQVVISATSISIIEKIDELKQILCISYFVTFKEQIDVLQDLESKVNV